MPLIVGEVPNTTAPLPVVPVTVVPWIFATVVAKLPAELVTSLVSAGACAACKVPLACVVREIVVPVERSPAAELNTMPAVEKGVIVGALEKVSVPPKVMLLLARGITAPVVPIAVVAADVNATLFVLVQVITPVAVEIVQS